MKNILTFDIGGTKLSHCLINEKGDYVSQIEKISTPKTAKEIFEYLQTTAKKYDKDICAIAIATAGAVNNENTKVVSSTPNLPDGYREINFAQLSNKLVYVENDANAAAWCEFILGEAKNYKHNITLTIGTGVGGGIIVDGKLLKGAQGLAGEVGSIQISFEQKRQCTCGNYDCWESYASGTGLKKTAEEVAITDESFKQSIFSNKKPHEVTTYDIIEGNSTNDIYCQKVYTLWHKHLLSGVLSLTNIFNTELIVFSGGLGNNVDTDFLQTEVNKRSVVSPIRIIKSEMKNNTGMIGAALLAVNEL